MAFHLHASSPAEARKRLIYTLGIALMVAIMAIGGLSFGLYSTVQSVRNQRATHSLAIEAAAIAAQSKATADCVNRVLGERNLPSAKDANAHDLFAKSLKKFLDQPTPADRAADFAQFQKDIDTYVQTLDADQQARDASQLGQC